MWNEMEITMNETGIIEYGIFQRDRKPNTPMWRRHKGGQNFRFNSVSNALFAEKGARNACYGTASYPKSQYSSSSELLVPYVASWLKGSSHAYLVRASAGDPEITIVSVTTIDNLEAQTEAELSESLAEIFASGAEQAGIRLLGEHRIRRQ